MYLSSASDLSLWPEFVSRHRCIDKSFVDIENYILQNGKFDIIL